MNSSELYHIFSKLHETKHKRIYVVQLDVTVNKKIFSEIMRYAKVRDGYYSSFEGVNGFVFDNRNAAIDFGKRLDSFLYIPDDGNDVDDDDSDEEVQETTETKDVTLNDLCSSLHTLIEEKGVKILSDTIHKTIETLNSAGCFKSLPPSIKFILRTFIMKQYGKKLLSVKDSEADFLQLISDFVYEHGFQQDLTEAVFDCVRDAIDGLDETQSVVTITTTSYRSTPKQKKKPTQQTQLHMCDNFYSIRQCKFIFNVEDNVGNPDFAIFRRKVERIANLLYQPKKIAYGYEFNNKATLNAFIKDFKTF